MENQNLDHVLSIIEDNFKIKVSTYNSTKLSSLTNDVFKVTCKPQKYSEQQPQNPQKEVTLIYKVYKNQLSQFINRDAQQFILQQLSKKSFYPKIYLINEKERIQQYVHGQELTVETASPQMLQQLVKVLARFSKKFTPIFQTKKTQQKYSRQIKNLWVKFKQIYEQMKQRQPQQIEKCKSLIQRVLYSKLEQSLVSSLPKQMILSHNDSNLTNIMVKKSGQLQLLDFQFADMNYIGFDIGNFLNQYATQYHNGFQIRDQWELNESLKEVLINKYFAQLSYQVQNKGKVVELGRLLSHIFWMFIGVRQIGDKNGLDMVYYVRKRFQELNKYAKTITGQQL